MAYERTVTSRGHKYRQLVESRWDPKKKQPRTVVLKHLGTVIEKDGKEILKPSALKIDQIDNAYPVGKLAVYWKLMEELNVHDSISKSFDLNNDDIAKGIQILALNQLVGRKSLTKLVSWVSNGPLSRWLGLEGKNLTKDYFLSALDNISQNVDSVFCSYSNSIQHNLRNGWSSIRRGPSCSTSTVEPKLGTTRGSASNARIRRSVATVCRTARWRATT